ncbi:YCF48-related protein [Planctomicrobium sp. SH527]|uniref:YCF48-related protein n=1 Tax=Planctomicrobium sp. SH527 TaxID=3448123 RepID=UPI003F5C6B3B
MALVTSTPATSLVAPSGCPLPRCAHVRTLTALLLKICVLTLLPCAVVFAAEAETPATVTIKAVPTPANAEQDDASLHGLTSVGNTIWAVGDQGVIWRSKDAGETWQFLALPNEVRAYSFRSVCFLTDRVGWIVGGTVRPVGGALQGVVLTTKDGGESWVVQTNQELPYLRYVKFFDLELGIAVGDRSTTFPGGVIQSEDGGQTWSATSSSKSGRWNAAAFTGGGQGILGGDQSRQAAVSQGSVNPAGSGAFGLQAWRGASIDATGRAWMAGEGAALSQSTNFGVSWTPVTANLPQQLDDFTNFQCVTHRENHVWAAGSPGAVIWHSADAGTTWRPQRTGDAIPLNSITFLDDLRGIAIGELGRICRTDDGGKSWQNVRGTGRRLACLAIQSQHQKTPIPFLTRWSKEDGYRTAVMVATRRDLGDDAHLAEQLSTRLAHSAQSSGASRGWIDWRLPVTLPMLENDRERLLEEWTLLTDRRLSDVLLASIVGEIRTWRPSVLLIDEPANNEFSAELLYRAISKAIQLAADPTFALNQTEISGLKPWQVQKLVMQRGSGVSGTIRLDPFEVLPRQNTTLELASAPAMGQLHAFESSRATVSEFIVSRTFGEQPLSDRNVFGDLALAPGGEARRLFPPIRELDLDRTIEQARHRRTITAASERIINDPQRGGQLLAQLKEIIGPLSPEQAAQQLSVLGTMYHQRGEWQLAESVYSELITRYPEQPPAVEAMVWLMKYWSSAEMNWQRLRTVQTTKRQHRSTAMSEDAMRAAVEQSLQKAQNGGFQTVSGLTGPSLTTRSTEETIQASPSIGNVQSVVTANGASNSPYDLTLTRWQKSAVAVSESLKAGYPHLSDVPEIQFVTAALMRRRGDHRRADEIYGRYMQTLSDDPWNLAARGEAFLLRPGFQSPKPIVQCRTVSSPPVLDGLLSDACWAQAIEIRLGEEQSETYIGSRIDSLTRTGGSEAKPVVFIARDARFLYLAATVPIDPSLPNDPPELPGRTHDSEFANFDRLCFQFDVDRDYATYYQFEVDQRGHTRDSCWGDQSYNPSWFCAATRTADAWRVECAIPLDELLPADRISDTAWGVGITRIMPGRGSHSWTSSGATVPQPAKFGLVRFE